MTSDVCFKTIVVILDHLKYSLKNNDRVVQKGKILHYFINYFKLYADELRNNSAPFLSHNKVKYLWQQVYALYGNCLKKNKQDWAY